MECAEKIHYEPDTWAVENNNQEEFFESLLLKLSPTLRRICHKLSGPITFMNDEDLYQEALLHLWTVYGAREMADKTDSYILQGCYFYLKNYIRKMQDSATIVSLSEPAGEDGVSLEEVLPLDSLSSFDEVEGKLQIEAMTALGMTEREKVVLQWSLEDMTTREIGQKLGISHVSVVKIRNRLKDCYEKVIAFPQRNRASQNSSCA